MMSINYLKFYLIALIVLFFASCDNSPTGSDPDLSDTLDPVENVQPIPGGDNATIVVNRNHQEAYFTIQLSNIGANDLIENSTREAWCIDWTKPIGTDNSTYNGIKLYSTDLVKQWKPVNYLLNISNELRRSDSELTWREFQIAIWSIRANPEFNLDTVATGDLPSDFRNEDGEPNFDHQKVREILAVVNDGYEDFNFTSGTKYAIIAETPVDVQTVFVVVEKK